MFMDIISPLATQFTLLSLVKKKIISQIMLIKRVI